MDPWKFEGLSSVSTPLTPAAKEIVCPAATEPANSSMERSPILKVPAPVTLALTTAVLLACRFIVPELARANNTAALK